MRHHGSGCQRCGLDGNDVHHMDYKQITDVTVHDLAVLCRGCHKLAERAKRIGYLRMPHDLNAIKALSEDVLARHVSRKRKKAEFSRSLAEQLDRRLNRNARLFVYGILKITPRDSFTELAGMAVAQGKLDHILWVMRKRANMNPRSRWYASKDRNPTQRIRIRY